MSNTLWHLPSPLYYSRQCWMLKPAAPTLQWPDIMEMCCSFTQQILPTDRQFSSSMQSRDKDFELARIHPAEEGRVGRAASWSLGPDMTCATPVRLLRLDLSPLATASAHNSGRRGPLMLLNRELCLSWRQRECTCVASSPSNVTGVLTRKAGASPLWENRKYAGTRDGRGVLGGLTQCQQHSKNEHSRYEDKAT